MYGVASTHATTLSCTFSLLDLPPMSQCLTQQTESEWPCLWMVGRSCMTDNAVWTQHWSFFFFIFFPENRPWLWVFARHSQHQWFSHSLCVNMQLLFCICKCRWTSELTQSGIDVGGGANSNRQATAVTLTVSHAVVMAVCLVQGH